MCQYQAMTPGEQELHVKWLAAAQNINEYIQSVEDDNTGYLAQYKQPLRVVMSYSEINGYTADEGYICAYLEEIRDVPPSDFEREIPFIPLSEQIIDWDSIDGVLPFAEEQATGPILKEKLQLDRNLYTYQDKPFWIGAVDLNTHTIVETHSHEEAIEYGFEHVKCFSQEVIDKEDADEYMLFWSKPSGEIYMHRLEEDQALKEEILSLIQPNQAALLPLTQQIGDEIREKVLLYGSLVIPINDMARAWGLDIQSHPLLKQSVLDQSYSLARLEIVGISYLGDDIIASNPAHDYLKSCLNESVNEHLELEANTHWHVSRVLTSEELAKSLHPSKMPPLSGFLLKDRALLRPGDSNTPLLLFGQSGYDWSYIKDVPAQGWGPEELNDLLWDGTQENTEMNGEATEGPAMQ